KMRIGTKSALVAGTAALASAALFSLRALASDCDDDGQGEPPFSVYLEGAVRSIGANRFTVGGSTVVVDPDAAWSRSGDEEDMDYPSPATLVRRLGRLRKGDGVTISGSLAAD